jgi:cytoskeleton protein RodZ
MESLGKYLKTERERRNLSLEEAAKSTKIRIQFLRAIEEDRYELLLPSVYVKGFLTQYVRYLGLNPNEVILRYQEYQKSLNVKLLKVQPKIPLSKKRVILWFFCMFNKFKKILVDFISQFSKLLIEKHQRKGE